MDSIPQATQEVNPETGIHQAATQGQKGRGKALHADDNLFKDAANKIIEESAEKYGTGLTMSANDGILNEKDVYAIDQ